MISTLIISFTIGFTCGRCNKNFNSRAKDDPEAHDRSLHLAMGYPNVEAVYECPDDIGRMKHRNHEPQVEDNVAYAPLHYFQH